MIDPTRSMIIILVALGRSQTAFDRLQTYLITGPEEKRSVVIDRRFAWQDRTYVLLQYVLPKSLSHRDI